MTTTAGALMLVALLVFGLSNALPHGSERAVNPAATADVGTAGRLAPPPEEQAPGFGEADEMSETALHGDEVSRALAKYGIDREGKLFEVHSPETEVPRLGGPTI